MYPAGFAHDNVVQGRAVPVGAGRAARRSQNIPATPDYRLRADSMSSGSRSGGSSPDIVNDSDLYNQRQQIRPAAYSSAQYASARYQRHARETR